MEKQRFQFKEMTAGVCYYPEHWPKEMWRDDLRRIREAGISVIRIAEFAWTIFEPVEGTFSFDFFDEFLAVAEEEGIKVIFGTPSATPPAWLTEKYPEALNARKDGVLLRHGGRRHYNYNSPVYRKLTARIVEQLARHYGQHPCLVGWQIDNELNCETSEFYSEADHAAFRSFLKEMYGTLDALNAAWGTVFWSETYTDWEQLHCPRPVINNGDNPHLMLDYRRFVSASCLTFAGMQAEIIRKYKKPGDFITTNGLFGDMDNHKLQQDSLDIYTYDSYPNFAFEIDRDPKHSKDLNDRKWTRNLTETRSVCPHFGIMEQQSGGGGWTSRMEMPAPRPGQLTLWAMQSVAQGADFISFFRWRTCAFGTEMYWHGILDYDGRDNRKLAEVKDFISKMKTLDPVCGAENAAGFALLKDYDNIFDSETDIWHRRIASASEKEIFAASELNHTPYNIVYMKEETELAELAAYKVLVYPHPFIMSEKRAEVLKQYVANGGTLIVGCRSGLKDMNGKCVMLPQPGLLQELTGTDVRDFTYTSPNEDDIYALWNGEKLMTPVFNDVLTPLPGTEVLAAYGNGYYKGEAALTRHAYGKGQVLHLGSTFTREGFARILDYAGVLEPFREIVTAPEDVEVVLREKDGQRFLFVLNFMAEERTITLHKPGTLLYTGETVQGEVTLPAFGTAVYRV
ncbi:MAG: beta-galactosidase [Lachnospiraceae bacterium]|nr:beta-galactosidase [Lachnospiraceae bacterium]